MKNKNRVTIPLLFAALVVAAGFVFTSDWAYGATTVGNNITTDGNLTVSGSSTFNGSSALNGSSAFNGTSTFNGTAGLRNVDISLNTAQGIVIDYAVSANAATQRTTWTQLFGSLPCILCQFVNNTNGNLNRILYTHDSDGSTGSAPSFASWTMTNRGDNGERARLFEINYNSDSTAASVDVDSSMLSLGMLENINNFRFPYGVIVSAGSSGNDADVDNLLTTGFDASDPDITNAINIGSNTILGEGTVNFDIVSPANNFLNITNSNTTGKASLSVEGNILYGQTSSVAFTGPGTIINLPVGNYFHVTGTDAMGTINFCDSSNSGRVLTLIFDSTVSLSDTNNLKLAGAFNATADDTITLLCDGTNWYEKARSVN